MRHQLRYLDYLIKCLSLFEKNQIILKRVLSLLFVTLVGLLQENLLILKNFMLGVTYISLNLM